MPKFKYIFSCCLTSMPQYFPCISVHDQKKFVENFKWAKYYVAYILESEKT